MKNEKSSAAIADSADGVRSRVSPLVPLKAEGTGAPIFMAHGLGDSVGSLVRFATCMQVRPPIYGMQARGLDGIEKPQERIEEMAEFHLEAVRRVQPRGPYTLIGYSLGGLVTLEIARRLKGAGDQVALLVMLDSYPDRRRLALGQRLRVDWRIARLRVASLMRGSSELPASGGNVRNATGQTDVDESKAGAWQRVKDAQYRALREYRPAAYGGKVKFVRATIPTYFPADPVPFWSGILSEMEVETVPGSHLEMLSTQVETVASVVRRHVMASQGG
jgi:acetoacetyl-CoA synthetase